MSEEAQEARLAKRLEDMAREAFGIEESAASRAAAKEIAGLLARLSRARLESWETPSVPKIKE